uniref:Uncharacterized protein n=1 Tax=Strigamia maritima TaxID=126957 RepID=T1JE59_STRMM
MKCLLVAILSACFLQVYSSSLNHSCYAIRNATGIKVIDACIDCFKKAYPKEPKNIDKLDESAHECVKQLPASFQKCLTADKDQKGCIEKTARKHFRAMRKSFWHHYENTLTKEQKCKIHQYRGIAWYLMDVKIHSNKTDDVDKVNKVIKPCRNALLDNYKLGKRDADEDESVDNKEVVEEENLMEEADRLKHNIGLLEKYYTCMMEEVNKNDETRQIFIKDIENNCHDVPLMIVKTFFDLKIKA